MISEVWGLECEGSIVGVRVKTNKGKFFDIDIDVYKNQLKLDTRKLPTLELIEFDDLLMSIEEYETGELIPDASKNHRIVSALKSYMTGQLETDPEYQARRRDKISKIVNSYYGYLDSLEELREFAEYHLEHFEGNQDIYTSLTKEQFGIVKDYFRWRSKLIFDEKRASKVLRTKTKKAFVLADLMGDAKDWFYDGTVDTGYLGASNCELGHALRYEHYAYSPSLDKSIVFGATCMSDFFEVDPQILKAIVAVQEVLMKEVKIMVYIMRTGRYNDFIKKYEDFWDVMKHFKSKFNEALPNGAGWSRFLGGFVSLKLPLTRSLLAAFSKLQWKRNMDLETDEVITLGEYLEEINLEATEPVELDINPFEEPEIVDGWVKDKKYLRGVFQYLEHAKHEGRLKPTLFAFTIIPTIRKMGRMSMKQKKYIDEALEILKSEDSDKFQSDAPENYEDQF